MSTRHKSNSMEFNLLIAATLPVFFCATIVKRVLPWNWGSDKRSLFAATRAAAHNSIPFAFM